MNRKLYAVLFLLFSFSSVGMGQITPDALKLDLTQDGLDVIAREIQTRFMRNVNFRQIKDLHKVLSNGWNLDTVGLNYSVDFKKLNLRVAKDGVHVEFSVNSVALHADSIKVSRPWLWWTLRSNCTSVDVSVSGSTGPALSVRLMPLVTEAGNLDADLGGVDFVIDPDAYVVQGPAECSGILGFGSYIRDAVAGVLSGARDQIADIVKKQVVELLPEAFVEIDGMLHQSFELHVGYPGIPFSEDLLLTGSPAAIEAHDGRLVFVMRSDISAISRDGFLDHRQKERRAASAPPRLIFGSVGLNKKVINDALEALHPMAQKEFELKPDTIPQLGAYLNADALASIWPDLHELDLDTKEIRAFVSLPGLPSIEALQVKDSARAIKFAINIPDARLSIMVKTRGVWMNYANISARLSVPLGIDMEDGEMEVKLSDPAVVAISGGWANDYQPSIDIFEADLAQVMMKSVFDMVFLQGPFLQFLVPVYDFGGGRMGFANPRPDGPYFSIDLISAK